MAVTRKEIQRRYREKNREKLRLDYADYCRRKGDEVKEQKRRYAAKNIEKERARSRAKYYRDREKYLERTKRYNKAHPEKAREIMRRHRLRNPHVGRIRAANQRALKRGIEGKQSQIDVFELFKLQKSKCGYCKANLRKIKYHIDHIKPLAKGGLNVRANLQLLCQSCNCSKQAKDPIEFARHIGMLL